MDARLDHVVLWVEDPLRSLDFYERVVGLAAVRAAEFREGKVPFPSVRVAADAIIDLMARAFAPGLNAAAGAEGSAGHPVNHVCLALARADYDALRRRLAEHGVDTLLTMTNSFGARGLAPEAVYFRDPDGNVMEARYYG